MHYWDFSGARYSAAWLLLASLVSSGTQADVYRLSISEKSINLIGETQQAVLVDQALPAPTLHWREG